MTFRDEVKEEERSFGLDPALDESETYKQNERLDSNSSMTYPRGDI